MDTYLNIWSFSEAAEVLGSYMTLPLMVSSHTQTQCAVCLCMLNADAGSISSSALINIKVSNVKFLL